MLEYKTIKKNVYMEDPSADINIALNEWALKGWEFVSLHPSTQWRSVIIIFSRKKK